MRQPISLPKDFPIFSSQTFHACYPVTHLHCLNEFTHQRSRSLKDRLLLVVPRKGPPPIAPDSRVTIFDSTYVGSWYLYTLERSLLTFSGYCGVTIHSGPRRSRARLSTPALRLHSRNANGYRAHGQNVPIHIHHDISFLRAYFLNLRLVIGIRVHQRRMPLLNWCQLGTLSSCVDEDSSSWCAPCDSYGCMINC